MSGTSAECLANLILAYSILLKWAAWAHIEHSTLADIRAKIKLLDPEWRSPGDNLIVRRHDVP